MVYRTISLAAIMALAGIFSTASVGQEPQRGPAGFSPTKPEKGPSVQVEGGYLVPYTLTIPGTEVKFDMLPIPGGEVNLGSPGDEPGHKDDEGPQVKIEVGPMWVAKHETSWEEYKLFMSMYRLFKSLASQGIRKVNDQNAVDAVTAPTELYDPSFTFEFGEDNELPAVTMTQYAAKQYTKWLSKLTGDQYRLPTEAEWEYACRAGSTTAYGFGADASQLDEYAWYAGNSDAAPHRIGTKKPNAFGLYDMHGNVMEWTIEGYAEDGYSAFANKTQPLSFLEVVHWPDSAENRVARGGSFQDEAELVRSAAKLTSADEEWKSEDPNVPLSPWWYTNDPARGVGFRVFRSFQPIDAEMIKKFWEIDHEYIQQDVDARVDEGRGVRTAVDVGLAKEIEATK